MNCTLLPQPQLLIQRNEPGLTLNLGEQEGKSSLEYSKLLASMPTKGILLTFQRIMSPSVRTTTAVAFMPWRPWDS